ncbi:MAG TPA: hypothetical protein VNX02_07850 [Steroidobacteraceae bacterium]|jgi:hypothetical protein|nr:hypothetical protein [Steroidobacteraceae bacterium]
MSTTWEQLEGAALSLARSGPIKDRLADAYRNHLAFVRVEELPAVVREEFRLCRDALTRERPLRGEDAVRATVRKMSNSEADELACSVVRLFAAIVRECAIDAAHEASLAAAAAANGTSRNGVTLTGVTLNGGTHDGGALNGLAAAARVKNGGAQAIAV